MTKTGKRQRKPRPGVRIDNTRRRNATDFACAHCGPPKMAARWLKQVDEDEAVQYVAVCSSCWQRVYGGGSLERDEKAKAELRAEQRKAILRMLEDGHGGKRATLPIIARKLGVSIYTVRRRLQA